MLDLPELREEGREEDSPRPREVRKVVIWSSSPESIVGPTPAQDKDTLASAQHLNQTRIH